MRQLLAAIALAVTTAACADAEWHGHDADTGADVTLDSRADLSVGQQITYYDWVDGELHATVDGVALLGDTLMATIIEGSDKKRRTLILPR